MMIRLRDWRKNDCLSKFKPWLPRIYNFGGLIRIHWLFWTICVFYKDKPSNV